MIEDKKRFAIVNFGDESVALMQWLIENNFIKDTTLLVVDTGFYAAHWHERVNQAITYAKSHGLAVNAIKSRQDFSTLVKNRGAFPSKKFQWCAGLLKGSAINEFLDEVDPFTEAVLLFAKRKENNRFHGLLENHITESEHYDERLCFFPLWSLDISARNALINKTGLEILGGRSLECEPCIFSTPRQLSKLTDVDKKRLLALETKIGASMFNQGIDEVLKTIAKSPGEKDNKMDELAAFEMGCGSYFGCGE